MLCEPNAKVDLARPSQRACADCDRLPGKPLPTCAPLVPSLVFGKRRLVPPGELGAMTDESFMRENKPCTFDVLL